MFLQNRRKYLAAGMAIALLCLLIWALNARGDKLISRTSTSGIVLEIGQYTMEGRYDTSTGSIGLIQAEDGNKTRLSIPAPFPSKGDKVPLFKEVYESGGILYMIDFESWKMGMF